MADSTAAAHETRRETFSAPITSASIIPVDEKRFESELRRTDAAVSEEKRNREKFETRIEKSVNDLRGEMNSRFVRVEGEIKDLRGEMNSRFVKVEDEIKDLRGEMTARMNRLDDRLWWILGAVMLSILVPIVMKYL